MRGEDRLIGMGLASRGVVSAYGSLEEIEPRTAFHGGELLQKKFSIAVRDDADSNAEVTQPHQHVANPRLEGLDDTEMVSVVLVEDRVCGLLCVFVGPEEGGNTPLYVGKGPGEAAYFVGSVRARG